MNDRIDNSLKGIVLYSYVYLPLCLASLNFYFLQFLSLKIFMWYSLSIHSHLCDPLFYDASACFFEFWYIQFPCDTTYNTSCLEGITIPVFPSLKNGYLNEKPGFTRSTDD